ncbi:toll/interleukin-1 receptor domain-containing protein [Cyanobacteria bacterium FACHB-472]|nr:toll/interleukin-1 receptor domain-containing protein [Cyanobacteria bacterium FACHB-472]
MPPAKPIEVLYCCSNSERDEEMRQKLENHLKILQWQGIITTWHKGMIGAGKEWESETYTQLMTADIILLLISSDFFASDYNWNIVLERAKERHKARTARVIPVLLRRVDNWKGVFGNLKLKALPEGEKPVTAWRPYDDAFESIAKGIRDLIEELTASPFSLKSYPQIRVGVTAVGRTLASVPTVTASLLPKKLKSRRRKKANMTTVIVPAVISLVGGVIVTNHLPHILSMPSLAPNQTSNSIENITPVGWIRIGVVNNASSSLPVEERLIQSSNPRLAPSIDSLVVPSIGAVVAVKYPVNLRKDRPNSYLPKSLGLLKPGEKLVIVKVEPLVISDPNFPRKEVWAQVGR